MCKNSRLFFLPNLGFIPVGMLYTICVVKEPIPRNQSSICMKPIFTQHLEDQCKDAILYDVTVDLNISDPLHGAHVPNNTAEIDSGWGPLSRDKVEQH